MRDFLWRRLKDSSDNRSGRHVPNGEVWSNRSRVIGTVALWKEKQKQRLKNIWQLRWKCYIMGWIGKNEP